MTLGNQKVTFITGMMIRQIFVWSAHLREVIQLELIARMKLSKCLMIELRKKKRNLWNLISRKIVLPGLGPLFVVNITLIKMETHAKDSRMVLANAWHRGNMKRLILIIALLFGCGTEIPVSITIDPAFFPEQQEVIQDSLDHTCRAVGFCPLVTDDSPNRIIRELNWAKWDRPADEGFNDFDDVYINARYIGGNMTMLWFVVTHELLHYGIPDHPVKSGIMLPEINISGPMCIDQEAADAWCKEQDMKGCKTTC